MNELDTDFRLNMLDVRLVEVESNMGFLVGQSDAIKKDTEDLLIAFNALKGAWAVMLMLGKLSKPIAVISAFFGAYWATKGIGK